MSVLSSIALITDIHIDLPGQSLEIVNTYKCMHSKKCGKCKQVSSNRAH